MTVEQTGVTTAGFERSAAVLTTGVRDEPGVKLWVLNFAAETEGPRRALALRVLMPTLGAATNKRCVRNTYSC